MSDWSPEDLDKFFQDGSEQHDFEYNEVAWEQMEELLDAKKRKRSFFIWFFTGILSLITIFTIYYLHSNNILITDRSSYEEGSVNDSNSISNSNVSTAIETNEKSSITNENEEITRTKDIVESTTSTTLGKLNPRTKRKTSNKSIIQKSTTSKQQSDTFNLSNFITDSISQIQVEAIEKSIQKLKDNKLVTVDVNKNESEEQVRTANTLDQLPSLELIKDFSIENELIEKEIAFKEQPIVTKKKNNFFTIGILGSVESNTVEETSFCSPIGRIGLHLDYYFAKKYAVSLGANFSVKEYVAKGKSYAAPKGFWSRSIVPETVKADCKILEIPIYATYFHKGYASRSWYINAGLNNIFMLDEQYQYRYEEPDESLRQKWGTQNENQHWLSFAEVSTGYYVPFANRTSLMVGPYLQLPISGIGHGNIKVLSVGINAKYNFRLRK